jgi:hypothetical protein
VAGRLPRNRTRLAFAALCAFVLAVGLWNVVQYPPGAGYDAQDHWTYADGLVRDGVLPQGEGEYYTPPGFYAIAGSADWLAEQLGAGDPHRAVAFLNVFFLLGTVLLVRLTARELWPGRERLALAAAAYVALIPVTVKAAAMYHPETLSLFLCTLGLWACVRTFHDARFAPLLGAALGATQLVRAWGLWTVGAVAVALAAGRRWRELAVALAIAAVIPLPWYVHQTVEYGSPLFPQPPTEQAREETGEAKPIWARRPIGFYVDPGLPDVFTHPYRPQFLNRAVPTTYSETWGDYFGVWAWNWEHQGTPVESAKDRLQVQAVVGFLPTLLAIVGWLALLLASLRSPPRLAPALLPGLGILGYLFFTVSFPTPDGDVLKGTYMLSTTGAWALGFGYALDRLRGRVWIAAVGLLAICAFVEVPFLFYG